MYRRLVWLALFLTAVVVPLGAYVRLSDAGLGCPDWPGCYGKLTPHHAKHEINQAQAEDPHGPVSHAKAWKEMVHRYLASALGLLIIGMTISAWRHPRVSAGRWFTTALLGVVCLQGAFGAWTVTWLLFPAIVTGHLLFGMLTLMLLWVAVLRTSEHASLHAGPGIRALALLSLVAVVIQIALGGWVSTNNAALACVDFPTCQGDWLPPMRFDEGFHLWRELGMTASGQALDPQNLTAIHWVHRMGAYVVTAILLGLSWCLYRRPALRSFSGFVLVALVLQVGLGIANVLMRLPLPLAVGHNAGAAFLLGVLVWVNYRLSWARARR